MSAATPPPFTLHLGDCLEVMASMPADSIDALVSDPPYGLAFMGKEWDHGVPGEPFWREALRVAKPGAHLVAFGGTRTFHRLTCAIEDAGWEIRDCLSYLYGSGFPKSHNLDKTGDFCDCEEKAQRDVRPLQRPDVSSPVQPEATGGEVLLTGVQEQGASGTRAEAVGATIRCRESRMEGRGDVEAPEGQLLGSAVSASARMGAADGTERRLSHGAPTGDGATDRTPAVAIRSGASPESQSLGQPARKSRAMADERGTQGGGVWPCCDRCGKPRITRGLGTALKPAWEPIILARKPLAGTVAQNVAEHGTGALNVGVCRIETADPLSGGAYSATPGRSTSPSLSPTGMNRPGARAAGDFEQPLGRWPANVILDPEAAAMLDEQSGERGSFLERNHDGKQGGWPGGERTVTTYGDTGGASRFYYCAKASRGEREAGLEGMPRKSMREGAQNCTPRSLQVFEQHGKLGSPAANNHPTVKPIDLMRWLCRLVTPPGGLVLDPFMGSGSTGCAAVLEGFRFAGIEKEPEYLAIAERRIAHWLAVSKLPPTMRDDLQKSDARDTDTLDLFGAL